MAGGLSISRVSDIGDEYWPLTEFRFVLLLMAISASTLAFSTAVSQPRTTVLHWSWWATVIGVHAYVCASWLWGPQEVERSNELYELALLILTLLFVGLLLRRDPGTALRTAFELHYWFALAFTVTTLLTLTTITGQLTEFGIGGIGASRLLSVGVIAGFYKWGTGKGMVWLLPIPFFLAGILLSGSRAAVLALLLALTAIVTLGFLSSRYNRKALQEVSAGVVLLVFFMLSFFSTSFGQETIEYFWISNFLYSNSQGFSTSELYLADRDILFLDAWNKFLDSPLIGSGLGSYLDPYDEAIYPHNLLLGFAVDAGFLALAIGLFCMVFPFIRCAASRSIEINFALGGALFLLTASMFSGTYYDARWLWVFLWIACACRTELAIKSEQRHSRNRA